MYFRFPVYLNLHHNNCVVIGGGRYATAAVELLLQFGASVTVISPRLSDALKALDAEHRIRYIPRRHFRGDCANAYLAVAATDSNSVNIAVAEECKARRILVNVASPAEYGTFSLPQVAVCEDVLVAVHEESGAKNRESRVAQRIEALLPSLLEEEAADTEA